MRYTCKTIIGMLLLAAVLAGCSESEEETVEPFETPEEALASAKELHDMSRWFYAYEWAYATTLYGCDEFTTAGDLSSEPWNVYDVRLTYIWGRGFPMGARSNNCPTVSDLYYPLYDGIEAANLVIGKTEKMAEGDVRQKVRGEGLFFRGYNYYRLFAQFGGVPLLLDSGTDLMDITERASGEDVLNQVIADLEEAYQLLPKEKWQGNGSWTRYTAAHFLAKALLFRQSERNNSWNVKYDKASDLNRVVSLCNEVIAACPLASDYGDLYQNWTGIDCQNESLGEILMVAEHDSGDEQLSGNKSLQVNRAYNYFAPQFSRFSDGWVNRGPYIGEMDFQRCRPTEYAYSVFDNVNDARMWKTFKTVYGVNSIPKSADEVAEVNGITVSQVPGLGDEAIMFFLNKKSDHRFDNEPDGSFGRAATSHSFINPATGKWVPCAFLTFQNGQYVLPSYAERPDFVNIFCGVNKFADGTRLKEKGDSHRDVIMARTGETYLIKAEAQVRLGTYQEALATVNRLRARGQWKQGEERSYYQDGSIAFLKAEGGLADNAIADDPSKCVDAEGRTLSMREAYYASHTHTNTYYLSTGIAPTTSASDLQIASISQLPEEDEAILSQLGCAGDYDRMLNFIFNERTRELLGEWNRWEELSRAGLLIRRARAFNAEASKNITPGKHELRPMPTSDFIDEFKRKNGTDPTAAQIAAWQNPGY